MSESVAVPVSQRRSILEKEIQRYVKSGYRVVSQTDTSAQLIRPKTFHLLLAIVLLVLVILPFIIYLLIYMGQKDSTVYLTVDELGRLQRR